MSLARALSRPTLLLAALLLGGCVPAPPRDHADERIADATGVRGAVALRVEGGPVDEPAADAQTLALPDAVRSALYIDPRLQAALARLDAARADARQSRLLPNPVLSVVFRWPEGGGSPAVEASLAAEVVQLLTRPGAARAADDRLRAAAAAAVGAALDVVADVRERYAAVQASGELIAVLRDRLAILDRLLGITRGRLDAGEATRFDLLGLESQRLELLAEIDAQDLEQREQRLALSRLIGQPSGAADWGLAPWQPETARPLSERQWVEVALEHRPEVQVRRYEVAALSAELGLTRLSPFDGAEVSADAEREGGDWSLGPGVSLPLPLFDFGQARRRKARAALVEARHELNLSRRQVVEETRRAYAALASTGASVRLVRDELVPLMERRRALGEEQFNAGQLDVTGLLQAEEQLRAARTRLVELQRRHTEALVRLQRAAGGPGITQSHEREDVSK